MYAVGDRIKVIRYPDSGNGRSPMGKVGTVTGINISSMKYVRVDIDNLPGPNRGWLFLRSEIELIPTTVNNAELWV